MIDEILYRCYISVVRFVDNCYMALVNALDSVAVRAVSLIKSLRRPQA